MEAVRNVSEDLRAGAARHSDRSAVHRPGQRSGVVTFGELDARCDAIAHGLADLGLAPGDRTLVFVPPSAELVCLTHALFRIGAVPVLIDPGMGRKSLLACIEKTAPRALIGVPRSQLARHLYRGAFTSVELAVSVGAPSLGGVLLRDVERRGRRSGAYPIHPQGVDDIAAVLFTSGSTGPPKGVVATQGVFRAQLDALKELYALKPGEVDAACFPLFALFDATLGMTTVFPPVHPSRPARADPAAVHRVIEESGATFSFGSPAIWRRVLAWARAKGQRFSTLTRITIAGAPVPPELLCGLHELLPAGGDVHTPYGATEALPVSSLAASELAGSLRQRVETGEGTCVGRPAPGIELALVPVGDAPIDEWSADLRLEPGQAGEICVRGPAVTPSYLFDPAATKLAKIPFEEAGRTGFWHRMGDVGRLDEEGRLWLLGRKSHRLETGRGLLFPVPLENAFNICRDVHRTALVGVGPPGAERPHLVVEPEPGAKREHVEAALHARAQELEQAERVEGFLFHKSFPVDVRHNAKIHRRELKRWAEERVR